MTDSRVPIPFHVLFLDPDNGARSLACEALLNHLNPDIGDGRFRAFSAGVEPGHGVPEELEHALQARGVSPAGLTRKPWTVFAGERAERIDLVVTVCGDVEDTPLPGLHGEGVRVHWPVVDPMGFEAGDARAKAMSDVVEICYARADRLARLPTASLEEYQAVQVIADEAKPESHPEDYPASYGVTTEPEPGR